MAKELTIEEVKQKRIELEGSIMALVTNFEDETGLKCTYMDIQRHRPRDKKGYDYPEEVKPYNGPVENVNVNVDFEELF